ncbi:L-histidine N(alpha)-methyltransferase [Micromonospora sp. I033]
MDQQAREQLKLLRRLEKVISETEFSWSLCLVGEDQSRKLNELAAELQRPFSSTGDEKRIVSGYSYWGIEPAVNWQRACTDPNYPVMRDGIETFSRRWRNLHSRHNGRPYHYISLGPGTGEKDAVVLADLHPLNPEMYYVPVDMSAEMLRLGLKPIKSLPFFRQFRNQLLPVQLDFSVEENVAELNELRDRLMGDEPVLFSLLGNTMANFDEDVDLVERLSKQLLRPQDRLMVEVATASHLDDRMAQQAAREYETSWVFREFVISALRQNTDLSVNMNYVRFEGVVDEGRSLVIKVIYCNRSAEDLKIVLPNRSEVHFPSGDTIRLLITRKYQLKALAAALAKAGLFVESEAFTQFQAYERVRRFGMDLMLLSSSDAGAGPDTAARDVFRRPGK